MRTFPGKFLSPGLAAAMALALLLLSCSSLRQKEGSEKFSYKEPPVPPLEKPEIVPTQKFLRQTPSGTLHTLQPARIGIVALPDFVAGSDAKAYLRTQVAKAKQQGGGFLPLHYYIAPDGAILEGVDVEYCGNLAGKRIPDAVLVGVLGDYDEPANFMPEDQQSSLIQLCAWVCVQHSIQPSSIVPANRINPEAPKLGVNLMNWFGPTHMLEERVAKTINQGAEKQAKKHEKEKGVISSLLRDSQKKPEMLGDF
jgi:hypothetical protein